MVVSRSSLPYQWRSPAPAIIISFPVSAEKISLPEREMDICYERDSIPIPGRWSSTCRAYSSCLKRANANCAKSDNVARRKISSQPQRPPLRVLIHSARVEREPLQEFRLHPSTSQGHELPQEITIVRSHLSPFFPQPPACSSARISSDSPS